MRVIFFVLLLFIFGSSAVHAESLYICPMHPHISGAENDDCPICGMRLVQKVEDIPPENSHEDHSAYASDVTFHIDPSYVQALGVKTIEVTHHEFGKNIRAFGKIVPSTRLEYAVDVRVKGWIVDLAVDALGDTVKKGDLLFTYYSPDLMNAQSDFLIGSRVGNAEQRLRLHGMGDKAIRYLKEEGKMLEATPFYAPVDGTVSWLGVRKGSHLAEGGKVMALQDYSKVWGAADVPLRDAQFLKRKTPAKITVPETGERHESVIDVIHPVNNSQNRTVMVRLILDNTKGTLRPETYIDAVFSADVQSRLAVPVEAVLYGAMGEYVMEDMGGGYFKPVMVKTGITSSGLTEIKSGLYHGQRIVISGQFMLDAESNLRGGLKSMGAEMGGEHAH